MLFLVEAADDSAAIAVVVILLVVFQILSHVPKNIVQDGLFGDGEGDFFVECHCREFLRGGGRPPPLIVYLFVRSNAFLVMKSRRQSSALEM